MRILFTHSYFLRFDPKQWKLMQPYAPLGTLYAAAYLREKGHEVQLHDVMFEESPLSITAKLDSFHPDVVVVYDDGFNYLTKMCLTNMREAAFVMCKESKKYGCRMVVSSSDATDHCEEYLQEGADFIVIGEGEVTLGALIDYVDDSTGDIANIDGIAYMQNGVFQKNKPRKLITNLDSISFPAWDLADMAKYKRAWMESTGYFSINMSTTRGCPFKCNWCAKPIYGNRYNARSPKNVVEELMMLRDAYGFDHIWYCDDIFGLKPGWIKRFSELVAQHKLNFKYKIQSRADLLLDDEQIVPLAKSGCETVWIGAESGSQKILDAMDKGITIAQIEEATHTLKKNNIRVAFFLQFGYLGEEMEDIKATLAMLARFVPDEIGVSVSYPLPGTVFYQKVSDQLKQKANWTDSHDLALMFRSTYEPEFYKKLHEYVHDYFRVLRTREQIRSQMSKGINKQLISKLIRLPFYQFKTIKSRKLVPHTI